MPCLRSIRRQRRPVLPFFLALIFHGLLLAGASGQQPPAQAGSQPATSAAAPVGIKEDLEKQSLEKQKLVQEILQLKNTNSSHVVLWDRVAGLIPFITALVAVLGGAGDGRGTVSHHQENGG